MSDVMRSEYRELSSTEKAQIAELKHMGENFCNLVDSLKPWFVLNHENEERFLRAKTRMEEAVFWAVKGVTM